MFSPNAESAARKSVLGARCKSCARRDHGPLQVLPGGKGNLTFGKALLGGPYTHD